MNILFSSAFTYPVPFIISNCLSTFDIHVKKQNSEQKRKVCPCIDLGIVKLFLQINYKKYVYGLGGFYRNLAITDFKSKKQFLNH